MANPTRVTDFGKMTYAIAQMHLHTGMIMLVPNEKRKKQLQKQWPELRDRFKTSDEIKNNGKATIIQGKD